MRNWLTGIVFAGVLVHAPSLLAQKTPTTPGTYTLYHVLARKDGPAQMPPELRKFAPTLRKFGAQAASGRGRPSGWHALWPVAATVLVCLSLAFWVSESPSLSDRLAADDPIVDAEILEVPTGSEAVIFALEESEGGGVLIYISG